MSWKVASYVMSSRLAAGSLPPAPPLRAKARSALACLVRRVLGRGGGTGRLDQQPQLDELVQLFETDQWRDGVAALRFLDDQALGLDASQRFTDRGG